MSNRHDIASVTQYRMARIDVCVGDFDDFIQRYEQAVPPLSNELIALSQQTNVDRSTVEELTARNAPHTFMITGVSTPAE